MNEQRILHNKTDPVSSNYATFNLNLDLNLI